MMTWSEAFTAYIEERYGENAQIKAAASLGMSKSKIHYWCRGSRARDDTRQSTQRWSKGTVKASLPKEVS